MKTDKHIRNIFISITLSTLLIGCGSSTKSTNEVPEENQTPQKNQTKKIKAVTIQGKAIDGYLQFATVCLDIDQDGYCQDTEPHAQTKKDGSFKLDITPEIQKNADFAEAMLLVYGGRDSDSKLDFKGKLLAPQETTSVNVTPITTLVAKAVQSELTQDKKLDKEEVAKKVKQAKESVAKAFGLQVADIVKDPVAEKENIPKLIQQALKIQKTMEAISGTKDDKDSIEKQYEAFAKHIMDEVQIEKDITELIEDAFTDEENKDAAKIIAQKIDKSFEKFDNDLEKIAFVTKEDLKKIKKGKKDEIVIQDPIFELEDEGWEEEYIKSDYEDITGKIPTQDEIVAIKEKIGEDINQGTIKDNIEKFKDDKDFNNMYQKVTKGLKSIVASKTFYLKEYDYDEKKYTIQKITFDSNGIAKFKIKNNEEMIWEVKDNFLSQHTKRSFTGTSFESQTDKYVQFQYGLRIYKSKESIDNDISLQEKVKGKTFYLKKMESEDITKVVFDENSEAPVYDENGKYAILDIEGDRIYTHRKHGTTEYYYNRYVDDKEDYIVLDDIGDLYKDIIDGNIVVATKPIEEGTQPNVKTDDNTTTTTPITQKKNEDNNISTVIDTVKDNSADIARQKQYLIDDLKKMNYQNKVSDNEFYEIKSLLGKIEPGSILKYADKLKDSTYKISGFIYAFAKKDPIINHENPDTNISKPKPKIATTSTILDPQGIKNSAFKGVVVTDDGYSYVTSREGTLLVYDIKNINQTELPIKKLRLTQEDMFKSPHHIVKYENYLYISGYKLFVIDISDRKNPVVVETLDYKSEWNTPTISGTKLLLPSSESAILFDISQPQKPKFLSKFLSVGEAIISDDFIYGVKDGVLTKYTLTVENKLKTITSSQTNIDGTPYHMYNYKDRLVVVTEPKVFQHKTYIFDTSSNFKLLKELTEGNRIFGCKEFSCVIGNKLYSILDIDSNPIKIGSKYIGASDGFPYQATMDKNGWIYRGNQKNIQLDKLNIENIVIEKELDTKQNIDKNISTVKDNSADITRQKQYLIDDLKKMNYQNKVSDNEFYEIKSLLGKIEPGSIIKYADKLKDSNYKISGFIYAFAKKNPIINYENTDTNTSKPEKPNPNIQNNEDNKIAITSSILESNGLTATSFKGVAVSDGYSYVISRDGKLLTYDTQTINNKELPIKTLDLGKVSTNHIVEYENYLYISGSKLFIVDIIDRKNPKLIETLDYTSSWNTPTISDKKLLLPSSYSSDYVTLLDVSIPKEPKLLSEFSAVGKAIIADSFIYGVKDGVLAKYSLTKDNTLEKINTATTKIEKTPYHMYSYKSTLVVATGRNMYVFDTDENLKLIKKINKGSRIFGCKEHICILGNNIYNLTDIESLDISIPNQYLATIDGFPFQATIDDNGWAYRGTQYNVKVDKLDIGNIVIEQKPDIKPNIENNISIDTNTAPIIIDKQSDKDIFIGKSIFMGPNIQKITFLSKDTMSVISEMGTAHIGSWEIFSNSIVFKDNESNDTIAFWSGTTNKNIFQLQKGDAVEYEVTRDGVPIESSFLEIRKIIDTQSKIKTPITYDVIKDQITYVSILTGDDYINTETGESFYTYKVIDQGTSTAAKFDAAHYGNLRYINSGANDIVKISIKDSRTGKTIEQDLTFNVIDMTSSDPINVLKTGQSTGDAGEERQFTRTTTNPSGDVQDNVNNLTWSDTYGQYGYLALGDKTFTQAKKECSDNNGRLPTVDELFTTLTYADGRYQGSTFDTNMLDNAFKAREAAYFWADNGKIINYTTGQLTAGDQARFRCVKSGQVAVDKHLMYTEGDIITYDLSTGLEWTTATKRLTFSEAEGYCHNGLDSASFGSGWELPTINQLRSITNNGLIAGAILNGQPSLLSSTEVEAKGLPYHLFLLPTEGRTNYKVETAGAADVHGITCVKKYQ